MKSNSDRLAELIAMFMYLVLCSLTMAAVFLALLFSIKWLWAHI